MSLVTVMFFGASAANGSSIQVFAGAVGGSGNGSIADGCTTYGGPFINFFNSSSGFSVPVGGIGACGYSGSTIDKSGPSALSATQSIAGVPIAGGGTYNGSASAHADYGILGADATGLFTGTLNGTVLDNSMAAAFFTDALSLSSPNVVDGSHGFIKYQFTVHGTLTTGAGPNQEAALLFLSYNGGASEQLFHGLSSSNGGTATATINNSGTPPAGYTFPPSGLSGSASFDSSLYPLIFGTPASVQVGLLAEVLGSGDADFASTAELTGIFVYDSNGAPIADFSVSADSGTQYLGSKDVTSPVPEPGTFWLVGLSVLAVGWQRRRSAHPLS
jgi:hypothetical protein